MSGGEPVAAPRITRIGLSGFRTYATLDLPVAGRMVALIGENGAGKTNLLEAISLFSAGRGLRRADTAEIARQGGDGGFAVSIRLLSGDHEVRLGTGTEGDTEGGLARRSRIDGVAVSSPTAFAEHLRVVWLTPSQDGLFAGPAGDRRRFLDRLVLAFDARHGSRVNAYERALRSRNRLLEAARPDPAWLDGIEAETATLGIAIAAARRQAIERLAGAITEGRDDGSPFPWSALRLEGKVDEWLEDGVASAEAAFRRALRDGRARDAAAGRALVGPQASDLSVRHGPKDVAAALASTGEQKALLVGVVLAHARAVAAASGLAPIILLDEIAAHLDPRRRVALYEALERLGSQVFMSGADPALFDGLPPSAERMTVAPGAVAPA